MCGDLGEVWGKRNICEGGLGTWPNSFWILWLERHSQYNCVKQGENIPKMSMSQSLEPVNM